MEVYVDDEAKLTLHGLQQHYVKLKENEKNKKLFELLDVLEFNQVCARFWFVQNYQFSLFYDEVALWRKYDLANWTLLLIFQTIDCVLYIVKWLF